MSLISVTSVSKAAQFLRAGEVVVYPTETSYGLGADPASRTALKRIFTIKGREYDKPLSLIAASLEDAKHFVLFSPLSLTLAKKYWPGPLTLVLPAKRKVFAKQLGSKDSTLAIRVSGDTRARSLARMVGGVITGTSANRSGAGDSYTEKSVMSAFASTDEDVFFWACGSLPRRRPSTILREVQNKMVVLRKGALTIRL